MENKCPFCGADYYIRVRLDPLGYLDSWYCGSEKRSDREINRSPQCYETELAALRSLVREMGRIINGLRGLRNLSIPYYEKEAEDLLDRPEVKALFTPPPAT